MRKVLETTMFQVLGSFETLGSKLSHGTSAKFADVRTHLRKVFKRTFPSIKKFWDKNPKPFLFIYVISASEAIVFFQAQA